MKIHKTPLLAATLAMIMAMPSVSDAAVTHAFTTETVNGNPHSGTIAATTGDLLETAGSITASTQTKGSGNDTHLFSGAIETGTTGNPEDVFKGGLSAFIVFDLDITTNTLGYTIDEISTFTSWSDNRAGQSYTVSFSQIGQADFTLFSHTVTETASTTVTQLRIFDDAGGSPALATGVDAIRFDFNDAAGPNWSAYREIDIIGSAVAIPEPSAAALLCFSLGLLLLLRKR